MREVVAAELRRLILSGEVAPGSRLVEDRLAERLGVSRNPVREAIRVLSSEGFIEVIPRRGACVALLSGPAAEDLFDVRMALEPVAARLAAGEAPPRASRSCGKSSLRRKLPPLPVSSTCSLS